MINHNLDYMDFLTELKRKQESYKFLKKEDIKLIPDDELKEAVMAWMMGKVETDWSKELEIISTLPTPCQNVYSTVNVMNEILNGGFNQLFFNSTIIFAEMAYKGYTSIGLSKLSKLLGQAFQIYNENKEIIDKHNDGTLESFSLSYEEKLFDELDDLFSKEEIIFEELIVDYIRKNESYFGD